MKTEDATVIEHQSIMGGYSLLVMRAPGVAPFVQPGQFVHMKVPHLGESVLRRPFSVFRTESDTLSVLYKNVGKGTRTLQFLRPGESVSIVGPLGNGFPVPDTKKIPVIVAGGYGMAALYLTARTSVVKGVAFFGGRTAQDILCVSEFQALGWDVRVTTEDGSLGTKGRVIAALDPWIAKNDFSGKSGPEFFACGPNGMLKAVAERALAMNWAAWVSLDNNMGCGVGACLTCVVKLKADNPQGWEWTRSCREGPVFDSRDVLWDGVS
jgi:dihydroorotate dehydrogenase electron transfer subunit